MTLQELHGNITHVFNEDFFQFSPANQEFKIIESNMPPDVNTVRLNGKDAIVFKSELLDSVNGIFLKTNKNKFSFHNGCDGIVLYKKRNSFYLLLIEIKNSFNETKFTEVKRQLEASNSKIRLVLEFIEGFNFKISIKAYIISKYKKQDIEDDTMGIKDPEENRRFERFKKNKKIIHNISYSNCNKYPIKHKYKFNEFEIEFIDGNNKLITF